MVNEAPKLNSLQEARNARKGTPQSARGYQQKTPLREIVQIKGQESTSARTPSGQGGLQAGLGPGSLPWNPSTSLRDNALSREQAALKEQASGANNAGAVVFSKTNLSQLDASMDGQYVTLSRNPKQKAGVTGNYGTPLKSDGSISPRRLAQQNATTIIQQSPTKDSLMETVTNISTLMEKVKIEVSPGKSGTKTNPVSPERIVEGPCLEQLTPNTKTSRRDLDAPPCSNETFVLRVPDQLIPCDLNASEVRGIAEALPQEPASSMAKLNKALKSTGPIRLMPSPRVAKGQSPLMKGIVTDMTPIKQVDPLMGSKKKLVPGVADGYYFDPKSGEKKMRPQYLTMGRPPSELLQQKKYMIERAFGKERTNQNVHELSIDDLHKSYRQSAQAANPFSGNYKSPSAGKRSPSPSSPSESLRNFLRTRDVALDSPSLKATLKEGSHAAPGIVVQDNSNIPMSMPLPGAQSKVAPAGKVKPKSSRTGGRSSLPNPVPCCLRTSVKSEPRMSAAEAAEPRDSHYSSRISGLDPKSPAKAVLQTQKQMDKVMQQLGDLNSSLETIKSQEQSMKEQVEKIVVGQKRLDELRAQLDDGPPTGSGDVKTAGVANRLRNIEQETGSLGAKIDSLQRSVFGNTISPNDDGTSEVSSEAMRSSKLGKMVDNLCKSNLTTLESSLSKQINGSLEGLGKNLSAKLAASERDLMNLKLDVRKLERSEKSQLEEDIATMAFLIVPPRDGKKRGPGDNMAPSRVASSPKQYMQAASRGVDPLLVPADAREKIYSRENSASVSKQNSSESEGKKKTLEERKKDAKERFDSVAAAFAPALLGNHSFLDTLKAQLRPTIDDSFIGTVNAQLQPRLTAELRPSLMAELGPSIEASLKPAIKAQIVPAIKAQLQREPLSTVSPDDLLVNEAVRETVRELEAKVELMGEELGRITKVDKLKHDMAVKSMQLWEGMPKTNGLDEIIEEIPGEDDKADMFPSLLVDRSRSVKTTSGQAGADSTLNALSGASNASSGGDVVGSCKLQIPTEKAVGTSSVKFGISSGKLGTSNGKLGTPSAGFGASFALQDAHIGRTSMGFQDTKKSQTSDLFAKLTAQSTTLRDLSFGAASMSFRSPRLDDSTTVGKDTTTEQLNASQSFVDQSNFLNRGVNPSQLATGKVNSDFITKSAANSNFITKSALKSDYITKSRHASAMPEAMEQSIIDILQQTNENAKVLLMEQLAAAEATLHIVLVNELEKFTQHMVAVQEDIGKGELSSIVAQAVDEKVEAMFTEKAAMFAEKVDVEVAKKIDVEVAKKVEVEVAKRTAEIEQNCNIEIEKRLKEFASKILASDDEYRSQLQVWVEETIKTQLKEHEEVRRDMKNGITSRSSKESVASISSPVREIKDLQDRLMKLQDKITSQVKVSDSVTDASGSQALMVPVNSAGAPLVPVSTTTLAPVSMRNATTPAAFRAVTTASAQTENPGSAIAVTNSVATQQNLMKVHPKLSGLEKSPEALERQVVLHDYTHSPLTQTLVDHQHLHEEDHPAHPSNTVHESLSPRMRRPELDKMRERRGEVPEKSNVDIHRELDTLKSEIANLKAGKPGGSSERKRSSRREEQTSSARASSKRVNLDTDSDVDFAPPKRASQSNSKDRNGSKDRSGGSRKSSHRKRYIGISTVEPRKRPDLDGDTTDSSYDDVFKKKPKKVVKELKKQYQSLSPTREDMHSPTNAKHRKRELSVLDSDDNVTLMRTNSPVARRGSASVNRNSKRQSRGYLDQSSPSPAAAKPRSRKSLMTALKIADIDLDAKPTALFRRTK